jgi:hypothetical protein
MTSDPGTVVLAGQQAASTLLHAALYESAIEFPVELEAGGLPADASSFRKHYSGILPNFEAARLASDIRGDIAQQIVQHLNQAVHWQSAGSSQPLAQLLAQPAQPLALETHTFGGRAGWQPSIVYRGERWQAPQLAEFGAVLVERGVVTGHAGKALAWVGDELLDDGTLHLAGRKIAVMGGGAEMAPTRFWLEAGADVLWLDTAPPPDEWRDQEGMAGRLSWAAANTDLLAQPQAVLATLIAFADGDPLDLGLYAYAPGQGRELRLTATMNALVDALPTELVGSVTMLASPTTPTALTAADLFAMNARLAQRPAWEAVLAGMGLLGRGGGAATVGKGAASRTVVGIQGASYQAAQYVGKVLAAEVWAQAGEFRVSANTAAITRTRSLAHPVFTAAFGGAAAMGVETLTPRQSRRINGLLAVHDWLHPQIPIPGLVRVHGGIHTLPYPLEKALRIAATIGFARSPRLLRGLVTR